MRKEMRIPLTLGSVSVTVQHGCLLTRKHNLYANFVIIPEIFNNFSKVLFNEYGNIIAEVFSSFLRP